MDPTTYGDPLDYVEFDALESAVKEHLPPPIRTIALKWVSRAMDGAIDDFIRTLEPHLLDRVPDFRTLATHALVDMDEEGGPCAEARASRPGPETTGGAARRSSGGPMTRWRRRCTRRAGGALHGYLRQRTG